MGTMRISYIAPHQTAKILCLIYFILALFIIPLAFVVPLFTGQTMPGKIELLFVFGMPIFYGLFGYLTTVLGCFVYNFLAKRVGGIEINLGTSKK